MRYFEIIEARRNPEQNPKISVNEYIRRAVASAQPLSNTGFKNLFVSFTKLPKLGINPQSRYNTPIGIYAYPGEYVIEKTTKYGDKSSTFSMQELPFAGDQPWANIFRARSGANIIDLRQFTGAQYNLYCDKLKALLTKVPVYHQQRIDRPSVQLKLNKADADEYVYILMEDAKISARSMTPGGMFWYVTMRLSEDLGSTNNAVAWTEIFRRLGIDGFVDPGIGIIHPSEPIQAVFFGGNAIDLLDRVPNKYSPDILKQRQADGKKSHEIISSRMKEFNQYAKDKNLPSLYVFLHVLGNKAPPYFKRLNEETRLELLKKYPSLFYYIESVATPEEFKMAFELHPEIIGKLDSIERFVTLEEFNPLLKKAIKNHSFLGRGQTKRQFAKDIWYALTSFSNKENLHKQTDIFKSLIDIFPLIWEYFYNEFGAEHLDRDVVEYALKIAERDNYDKGNIKHIKRVLRNNYN